MKEIDTILTQAGLSQNDLDQRGETLLKQLLEAKQVETENPQSEMIQDQARKVIKKTLGLFKRLVAELKKEKQNPAPTEQVIEDTTEPGKQPPSNNQRQVKMALVKSPAEPKSSQKKEQEPIEVEVEEIPQQNSEENYQTGPMADFAQEYENQIAACRERIRAENRRKREIREAEEGPKPKVSRVVRLQRKILGVLSVMPPEKKHDQQALQITETLLSELLVGLADAWGLKVSREAQRDASQKFEDLHQKATKQ